MSKLVYFSSVSENTKRFIEKLELPEGSVARIPLRRTEEPLVVDEDFVLMVPTYGGGNTGERSPSRLFTSSTTSATAHTSKA